MPYENNKLARRWVAPTLAAAWLALGSFTHRPTQALLMSPPAPPHANSHALPRAQASAGGLIVFSTSRHITNDLSGFNDEIYVMNSDGTDQRRVTNNTTEDLRPAISPDGTKIVFTVNASNGRKELHVINTDGTGEKNLTPPTAEDDHAEWSPDGTKLVFESRTQFINQIYVMNADGTNRTRITNSPQESYDPTWSRDGTKIAFGRNLDIYAMNADGSNQTNLENGASPAFSPDGRKIAFWAYRSDSVNFRSEIYVMNVDGSNPVNLTNNAMEDYDPKWSPDGTKIVFWRQGRLPDGTFMNGEIFAMNADGSGQTNLTNHPRNDWYPDWQWLPASANPVDGAEFFVRHQYADFLNREPDAPGLAFWAGQITSCAADAACARVRRVNTSAAFFLSIEFQETGYLVYRFYKAAFGDINPPAVPVPVRFADFLPDTRRVGQGVQVGVGDWHGQLEANKAAFAEEFASRARFLEALPPGLPPTEFVDRLNRNAGGPLSQSERDALVADLASGARTRAQVLQAVAEEEDLKRAEFNRAFVLMQYFGYLRRDPDSGQDTDFSGYFFWLAQLNRFGGNFEQAEMVRAFIESTEYRGRFGQ